MYVCVYIYVYIYYIVYIRVYIYISWLGSRYTLFDTPDVMCVLNVCCYFLKITRICGHSQTLRFRTENLGSKKWYHGDELWWWGIVVAIYFGIQFYDCTIPKAASPVESLCFWGAEDHHVTITRVVYWDWHVLTIHHVIRYRDTL